MKTTSIPANYRIYDHTGGGTTEDIYAESLEDAIEQGREWIEAGDWEQGNDEETLACEVGEIVRDENGDIDADATWDADRHDCSGTLPANDAPECIDGDCDGHDWQSPYSVLGGCKENPGVWGGGHGQVMIKTVCACCGMYRTADYGATSSSNGTRTTRTTYEDADDASVAWLMRRLDLPESIEVEGVEVSLEWDETADIRQDNDAIGTASHTVDADELDAGIADGPNDGEVIEIEGMKFRLGSHDYETSDGQVTCSAKIYRVL